MRIGLGRLRTRPLFHTPSATRSQKCSRVRFVLVFPRWGSTVISYACPTFTRRKGGRALLGAQTASQYGYSGSRRRIGGHTGQQEHGSPEEIKLGYTRPPVGERQNADAWMILLDPLLPRHLRITVPDVNALPQSQEQLQRRILHLLRLARKGENAGTELLVHMGIRHGRWKAVLWLVDMLLQRVAARLADQSPSMTPSNIAWPTSASLDETCRRPIMIDALSNPNPTALDDWILGQADVRYTDSMSAHKDASMTHIWTTLGHLIIEAADMPEEQATTVMAVVYQIVAHIHTADLVPEQVYSYVVSNYSSTIQRPPILHLLSSRILTTASDAVWRSHQDEVIAQVSSLGESHQKDVLQNPPGGRFRLKVRPLGPEAWLEFVLWCCVDGGFASAGIGVIDRLRHQTEKRWVAATWSPSHNGRPSSMSVDWNRVKLRYGGTVGQIEGYSRERPFAEMPSRTISTEVVLALVETAAHTVEVGLPNRGSDLSSTQASVKDLISFLEPHDLPEEYLDYLTVRLVETGGFLVGHSAKSLRSWAQTTSDLHALERLHPSRRTPIQLSYDAILHHSEMRAGLLHQSLDGFVDLGDSRGAVEVFNDIQQLVDGSKLHSIRAFLSEESDFASNTASAHLEFVQSHGQLPDHKLASFFVLATDSRLVVLGQWLLYSDEVDGPLIPRSAYALSCMSAVLARFAAMSEDVALLHDMVDAHRGSKLKPSIRLLRSVVNAHISFFEFARAEDILAQTMGVQAGGYAPSNVAHLAAVIVSLDPAAAGPGAGQVARQRMAAVSLLEKMLAGHFDGNQGDFWMSQWSTFRRQIFHLLRVFREMPDPTLSGLMAKWGRRYESSNDLGLATSTFNVVLAATVQTKGCTLGRQLWDKFCQDPRTRSARPGTQMMGDDTIQDDELLGDWDTAETPTPPAASVPDSGDCIPFLPFSTDEVMGDGTNATDGPAQPRRDSPPFAPGISFSAPGLDVDVDETPDDKASPSAEEGTPAVRASNPVVVPDLRTLRIIVRAAVIELRWLQQQGRSAHRPRTVLRWAMRVFHALGMDQASVASEIDWRAVPEDEDVGPGIVQEYELKAPDVSQGFRQPGTVTRLPCTPWVAGQY